MDDPLEEKLQIHRAILLFCPCRSKEHGLNSLTEPYEASMPLDPEKQALYTRWLFVRVCKCKGRSSRGLQHQAVYQASLLI